MSNRANRKERRALARLKQEEDAKGREAAPPVGPEIKGRPLVDVVMPVFGEWSLLERAMDTMPQAFLGLTKPYRVVVVDNGTPAWSDKSGTTLSPADQSMAVRERLRADDVFVRLEENIGYPGGCNFGASKTTAPLVLIWTSDVRMQPGSVTRMVRDMDDPKVGVVGPLLLFPTDEPSAGPAGMVQHAGMAFDVRGDPFHIFIGWNPDNPKVRHRRLMMAVTGAIFLTRRTLWNQIGGFSRDYGAGTYEDMEYCFQTRRAALHVLFEPEAVGFHKVGGSIRDGAMAGIGGGFPLSVNRQMFKGRFGRELQWDEWRYW